MKCSGIDLYYFLSYSEDPPVSEFYSSWDHILFTNQTAAYIDYPKMFFEWYRYVTNWHSRKYPGKQILFTEVGYPSQNKAGWEPWIDNVRANNLSAQANGYEAFFRRYWGQTWLSGTFCNNFEASPPAVPMGYGSGTGCSHSSECRMGG